MFYRMYNVSLILLFIFLFILGGSIQAENIPFISAATGALINVNTGQILYEKNMHIKRPPASTTKILTTIIALEEANLDDIVTVSKKAAYQEGSSIYLRIGEKLTLEELLYGIMLASGNDAAVAVAEHISGSVEEFAKLMNKKAKDIGALNSNFLNPNGLPQSGHVSTAYDLAMIMRYALQNKTFAKINSTKYINKEEWERGFRNHNKLLWSYDKSTGGKTGYTRAAGRCLVSSAAGERRSVVAVVLNSPNDWIDSTRLLDFGLDNFNEKIVVNKGEEIYTLKWEESMEKYLNLVTDKPVKILVPKNGQITIDKKIKIKPNLELPIKKNDKLGKINIYHREQLIGSSVLTAANDLNFNSIFLRFWYDITHFFKNILYKKDLAYISRIL